MVVFRDHEEEIKSILQRLDIYFFEDEQKIMEQFDKSFKSFVITGLGKITAHKWIDTQRRISLGVLPDGMMIGIPQILYETQPSYSIESSSYSSAGFIHKEKFVELFELYRSLK